MPCSPPWTTRSCDVESPLGTASIAQTRFPNSSQEFTHTVDRTGDVVVSSRYPASSAAVLLLLHTQIQVRRMTMRSPTLLGPRELLPASTLNALRVQCRCCGRFKEDLR